MNLTSVAKFSPSGYYIASGGTFPLQQLIVDVSGTVRVWDAIGSEMTLKTETKVISGRINDIAWDGESQRIIAVGDGKERYGHAFTFDSANTVGEVCPSFNFLRIDQWTFCGCECRCYFS
jgi:WD repeat-containing protein 1 (actin-interacting protein 1)